MFEGKPICATTPSERNCAGELRPVTWSDLVAKLDAARDLRSALTGHGGAGDGSFDRGSAQHIAALGEGERGVNLDDLGNGKAARGMTLANGNGASGDPRE